MASLFYHPVEGVGNYPGGRLYFYNPGTLTGRTVYQDSALSIAHGVFVTADSAGVWPPIYLPSGTYRVILRDADAVQVYDVDNCDPGVSSGAGALPVASGGTGATTAAAARSSLGAAAAADLTAIQTGLATVQSQIASSLTASDTRLGLLAGKDTLDPTDLSATTFGRTVINDVFDEITGSLSTSSTIPIDDTIPQIGEGEQFWSRSYTPKRADSSIRITAVIHTNGSNAQVLAIFADSADAIAATSVSFTSYLSPVTIKVEIPSWGTTAKTLSARYGTSPAGFARINYNSGSSTLGGVIISSVHIEELI